MLRSGEKGERVPSPATKNSSAAAPFLSAHDDQACDYSREAMLGIE